MSAVNHCFCFDLTWDEKTGKFKVAVSDPRLKDGDDLDLGASQLIFLIFNVHQLNNLHVCSSRLQTATTIHQEVINSMM